MSRDFVHLRGEELAFPAFSELAKEPYSGGSLRALRVKQPEVLCRLFSAVLL